MKVLTTLSLSALIVLSQNVLAADNYSCKHGNQERVISVVYPNGGDLPCEVHYQKAEGASVLWNAENVKGYCEEKAAAFVEKQEGWGWKCDKAE